MKKPKATDFTPLQELCYDNPFPIPLLYSHYLLRNAKSLSSSDSLAKVQEVASWLLEMNQDLLSGGSGSREAQEQRPGAAGAGNSTSSRTPQPQAEHMNRVLEEQEQGAQQQRREPGEEEEGGRERPREAEEEPWPSGGEPVDEGRRSEVNGAEKGAQWMWEQEQRLRHRRHREEEEENEEEENNNAGREGQVGLRSEEDNDRPEDEEDGEEEMDQDSDEFEHSGESGREEEEEEEEGEDEEEGEEGLHSPSLRTSVSDLNDNTDQSSERQHQSSPSVCKNKDHFIFHKSSSPRRKMTKSSGKEKAPQALPESQALELADPKDVTKEPIPPQKVLKIFSINIIAQSLPFCRRRKINFRKDSS
ncbi:hypothetical protein cypCar_00013603 [Cyprinus carpio]|nr:hypothetical protein cypCar_00013603 [Cyprinus carpio]